MVSVELKCILEEVPSMVENLANDSPQAWDPSTSTWFLVFHMVNPLFSPLESWTQSFGYILGK